MKRTRITTIVAVMVSALVPGCGLILDFLGLNEETGSPQLKAFTSEKELTDYFIEQISTRNSRFADFDFFALAPTLGAEDLASGAPPAPTEGSTSVADSGADADSFSQTTLQERGVDESDVVKTDGTYVYIMDGGKLQIVDASDASQLALLSETTLEGFGRDIYLHDNKVIALTSIGSRFHILEGGGGVIALAATTDQVGDTPPGGEKTDVALQDAPAISIAPDFSGGFTFERPRTIVTIIDVTDPMNPAILSTTRFEGTQSSSRLIDGVLHLVVANFQNEFISAVPDLGSDDLDVSTLDAATLLPDFERVDADGTTTIGDMVTWQEMLHPTDPDGFGVVTAISLDVDNGAAFTAVGIVAEPGLVYSSVDALYLTDTEFNFRSDLRETTDIYKFSYVDRSAVATASGTVPGRVLNQYSMGEHNGNLRVATTVGPTFSPLGATNGPFNNVYVLGQVGDTLEVMGQIENIAPGETIQSARFLGDRGYLVTFLRVDPLFTLDLSEPTNPRVVGELKVPGFSTFILPIDADHLLTVGQFVPEFGPTFLPDVQLSIFDVTDFANPRLASNIVLGRGTGAFSEALFNPKAFTYFAEQGMAALPLSIFSDIVFINDPIMDTDVGISPDEPLSSVSSPPELQGFEGVVVIKVSIEDGLTEMGRIDSRFPASGFLWSSFTRGLFIGSDVFTVTDHGIRGAPISNIASVPYELLTEPQPN